MLALAVNCYFMLALAYFPMLSLDCNGKAQEPLGCRDGEIEAEKDHQTTAGRYRPQRRECEMGCEACQHGRCGMTPEHQAPRPAATKAAIDPPRPTLPRWNKSDEDFWTDMLDGYSTLLLAVKAEHFESYAQIPDVEECKACVRLAAVLADVAVQERQYRGFIQQHAPKAKQDRQQRNRKVRQARK